MERRRYLPPLMLPPEESSALFTAVIVQWNGEVVRKYP